MEPSSANARPAKPTADLRALGVTSVCSQESNSESVSGSCHKSSIDGGAAFFGKRKQRGESDAQKDVINLISTKPPPKIRKQNLQKQFLTQSQVFTGIKSPFSKPDLGNSTGEAKIRVTLPKKKSLN